MEYALGCLLLQIWVSDSRSLKDKRRVVKSLKDRLRNRHNVSVAEVAQQDSRAESTVIAVSVSPDVRQVRKVLDAASEDAYSMLGGYLVDLQIDVESV